MGLTAAHLDALLESGATAEQIVALVKVDLIDRERAADERRAKDAARQSRKRHAESRGVTRSHADTDGQDVTPSLEVSPGNPLPNPTPTPPYSPPASRRGTRLAPDFEPPEDWIEWAMKKRGWSRAAAVEESECFTRHWQAKPGRDACKLDWRKTWQNWVVNSRRQNRASAYDPERITV